MCIPIYDLRRAPHLAEKTTYVQETGTTCARAFKLPRSKSDLADSRHYLEIVLNEVGGPIERLGDDAVGELWSMYDARDRLVEVDRRYFSNVEYHIRLLTLAVIAFVTKNLFSQVGGH